MDIPTRARAHEKLYSIKDYIAYPEEMLVDSNLEELYKGIEISPTDYFQNGINISIWNTNKEWEILREKVCSIILKSMVLYLKSYVPLN